MFLHEKPPRHKSRQTNENLERRPIPTVSWPPYFPDLNLIEHVWANILKSISDRYHMVGYDAQINLILDLWSIIQVAWDAVPDG